MRQGYRDYSFFSYRAMSATGGTATTLSVNGRQYKNHSFPVSGPSTLTIHSQGTDKLISDVNITGNVIISGTEPAPANIGDVWVNLYNTTLRAYGFTDQAVNPSFMDYIGSGANSRVSDIAVQADGKIIAVGLFDKFSGSPAKYIVRLNSNGTLDKGFSYNLGSGPDWSVETVTIQPDGKIIIGGEFSSWNGTATGYIVRLNSDGTLDSSFIANTASSGHVAPKTIKVQPDGKILIGGSSSTPRLVRLNSDGTPDTTFINNLGTGANASINSIDVQANGKILVAGGFTAWNGVSVGRVVRLNSDGTRDSAFTVSTGSGATSGSISKVLALSSGKILLAGVLGTYSSYGVGNITRLNSDGTHDTAYSSNAYANASVNDLVETSDQKVFAVGNFTSWKNGATASKAVKLNENGTLDTIFNVGTPANNFILCVAEDTYGNLFLGGDFTEFNSVARNYLVKVNNEYGSVFSNSTPPTWYPVPVGEENSIYVNGSTINIKYPLGPYVPIQGMTASGGTVTEYTSESNTYRVHTFTSTGLSNFTVSALGSETFGDEIDYLVLGGGGSGMLGGGGAGGFSGGSTTVSAVSYTVSVGAGGPSNYAGTPSSGQPSYISGPDIELIAYGGGRGGDNNGDPNGYVGGSGGGAATKSTAPNTVGTPGGVSVGGQGFSGGLSNGAFSGGGGGGAGVSGSNASNTFDGAPGGSGRATIVGTGSLVYYAGGGAGAGQSYIPGSVGGGGGTYGAPSYNGMSAGANTGGGGGGGFDFQGAGGSGIVIIRYRIA